LSVQLDFSAAKWGVCGDLRRERSHAGRLKLTALIYTLIAEFAHALSPGRARLFNCLLRKLRFLSIWEGRRNVGHLERRG
jgi:hypothetical protein